jgi:hypothetical protein
VAEKVPRREMANLPGFSAYSVLLCQQFAAQAARDLEIHAGFDHTEISMEAFPIPVRRRASQECLAMEAG